MQTPNQDVILQKTLELCQAIVSDPDFQVLRRSVDAFMHDEKAKGQYQSLSEKGRDLHNKQHQGLALDPAEIAGFEKERDAFFANPIAKGFIEAQEQIHHVQEMVTQHVMKTYELGRTPVPADFESGCCGGHDHGDHGEDECCGRHEHGADHQHGGEGCQCKH